MLPRNHLLQNRYRIIRLLGKGGFGQVYEALDDELDCLVAIKERVARHDSEKLRRAFTREAKLLANLRHPSLPKVTRHFFEREGQYLVMEFIEGDDLAKLLFKRQHPFPVEQVMDWADELLKALIYLHVRQEPIIHRDIKPANIKLTDEGEIFLLDFGLAKGYAGEMSVSETGQRSSSVHGYTAAYAPLEQLNNSGTNEQSDIYSLGATLYNLVTDYMPVKASLRYNSIEMGQRDPLPTAHEINPAVPPPFSLVLSQAMAMNRRDRLGSAAQMRQAIAEARRAITETNTEPQLDKNAKGKHARAEQPLNVPSPMNHSPTAPARTALSPEMDPTLTADPRQHLFRMSSGPVAEQLPGREQPPQQVLQPSEGLSWPSHVDSESGNFSWASTVVDSELYEGEETSPQVDDEIARARESEEFERQEREEEFERQRQEAARKEAEEARLREEESERERLLAEQERLRAKEAERLKREVEEEERHLAEEAARRKAREEARLKAEEAKRAEEERRKAKEEAARLRVEEEEARRAREEEERRQAAKNVRLKAQEEESRKQIEQEKAAARRKSEEEEEQRLAQARVDEEAAHSRLFREAKKRERGLGTHDVEMTSATHDSVLSTVPAPQPERARPRHPKEDGESQISTIAAKPQLTLPEDKGKRQSSGQGRKEGKWKWIAVAAVSVLLTFGLIALILHYRGSSTTTPTQSTNTSADTPTNPPVKIDHQVSKSQTPHEFSFKQTLETQQGTVWTVTFSPDGSLAASAGDDQAIHVWDTRSWQLKFKLEGYADIINSVAFSPNGQLLASGGKDKTIRLWNVSDGSQVKTLSGHDGQVLSLVFSPDGSTLASAGADRTVKLWDAKTGQEIATLKGHQNEVWAVAFSPDGKTLASAGRDDAIMLWDLSTKSEMNTLPVVQVYCIAFSPDGKTLASGHGDNSIKLWNLKEGKVTRILTGHKGYVISLAFSPDGQFLASASKDKTIKVWDVKSSSLKQTLTGHGAGVESVAFSPDSKTVISGGRDKTVRVWQ